LSLTAPAGAKYLLDAPDDDVGNSSSKTVARNPGKLGPNW